MFFMKTFSYNVFDHISPPPDPPRPPHIPTYPTLLFSFSLSTKRKQESEAKQ